MRYKIKVVFKAEYPKYVRIFARKDKFISSSEFFCKMYPETDDIRDVPMKDLKLFVLNYLKGKLGDDEVLLNFVMDDSGKEH